MTVVRRPSTFDVYILETTLVIRFLWNLVRIFVLSISSTSSNMGHVWSKTRSPGQILENSCLHSRPPCMLFGHHICVNYAYGIMHIDTTSANTNKLWNLKQSWTWSIHRRYRANKLITIIGIIIHIVLLPSLSLMSELVETTASSKEVL